MRFCLKQPAVQLSNCVFLDRFDLSNRFLVTIGEIWSHTSVVLEKGGLVRYNVLELDLKYTQPILSYAGTSKRIYFYTSILKCGKMLYNKCKVFVHTQELANWFIFSLDDIA